MFKSFGLFFIFAAATCGQWGTIITAETLTSAPQPEMDATSDTGDLDEMMDRVIGTNAMEMVFEEYGLKSAARGKPRFPMKLGVGGGFKRNLLLSAYQIEDSPFTSLNFDFQTAGTFTEENDYLIHGMIEDFYYSQLNDGDFERGILIEGAWKRKVSETSTFGLRAVCFQFRYFEEDYERSGTEIPSLGRKACELGPSFEHSLQQDLVWRAGVYYKHDGYQDTDDSYSRIGINGEIEKEYWAGSRFRGGLRYEEDQYEEKSLKDGFGKLVPNTTMQIRNFEASLANDHAFGIGRNIRNLLELRWLISRDNGPGYYDLDQIQMDDILALRAGSWRFRLEVGVSYQDYRKRIVADSQNPAPESILTTSEKVQIACFIQNNLSVFVRAEWAKAESNEELDEYRTGLVIAGINWTF